MIVFKKLTWRNFLSTGNQPTVLLLDKSPTTLVLGVNGSGKSTMLDALCFVLYKKPFRKIKKDQIVNTINGSDCVVAVEFEIGTHHYEVRRGIKPDFCEIYEDHNLEPRHQAAGQKDDQAYLEEDILKVDYDSFTQIVILGNAKYTPFMQLTTPKRREFIEFILDIGVFSDMNAILKTLQTGIVGTIESLNKDIETHKEKMKLVDGFITKLEAERNKVTIDTQRQIDEQNRIIDALNPDIEALQEQINLENAALIVQTELINSRSQVAIDTLQEAHDSEVASCVLIDSSALNNKLVGFSPIRNAIQRNVKTVQTALDFYLQNDSCKACKQSIQQDFKDKIIAEKQAEIVKFETGLFELDVKCDKLRADIANIKQANEEVQSKINQAVAAHQTSVRKILADTQSEIKTVTGTLQTSIRTLQTNLQANSTTVSAARQFVKKMQTDIKNAAASTNLDDQYKKKASFSATCERLELEKAESIETQHYYDVAAVLLKDTGIKAAIIKQYLATINKLVNKYLAEMDFFLSFHLDENFDETFKSRHRDTLQYYNFSEGEKMRIDLALLFSWREIAHMKNSCSTNLLILDEVVDSSLDHNGTDFFIKMLNELSHSNQNVFVISHKNDAALDKFKDVLRFQKIKNFSRLVEE